MLTNASSLLGPSNLHLTPPPPPPPPARRRRGVRSELGVGVGGEGTRGWRMGYKREGGVNIGYTVGKGRVYSGGCIEERKRENENYRLEKEGRL